MSLKTLVKLAKGRAIIPVLETIRVVDGIAMSTDLDFYISAPVSGFNKKDGDEDLVYFPHGFDKGIHVKSTIPVTDFPMLKEFGKPMIECKLSAAHIEAIAWTLKAASREETRYYLNGIYFAPTGDIVAIDGHRLHGFKAPLVFTEKKNERKGAILPKLAVALILDVAKETKATQLDIVIFDNETFQCQIGTVTVSGKMIDGSYPDYTRVIPKKDEKTKTTIWNPEDLKQLKAELTIYAKIVGERKPALLIGNKTATLTRQGDLTEKKSWPITAEVLTNIGAGGKELKHNGIGFNAAYMADLCGGVMQYTDAASPVLIEERRGEVPRFCVLMPLRV